MRNKNSVIQGDKWQGLVVVVMYSEYQKKDSTEE